MFHSLENTPDRPTKALQYKSAAQISNQATPIQQRRNQPLQPIRPHQQQPGDSDLPRPDGRVATISWPPSQPSSSPSATPPAPKWSPSALATMPSADVRSTAAHTNHAIKRSSEAANVLEEAASKKFKPSITPVVSKPTSAHPPTATQGPPSASAALPTCFFCFANTLGSFTPWHGVRYCDECRKKHARSKYIGPYRNLAMKFLLTKGQVSRVPFVEQPTEKAFYYISKREDLATKAEQVHGSLRACLEKKLRKAEQQAIKNDAADAGASGENEDDGENAGYRNKSNGTAPAAASTNQVHPVPVPRPSVPFKPWNAPMMSGPGRPLSTQNASSASKCPWPNNSPPGGACGTAPRVGAVMPGASTTARTGNRGVQR
ncbi:hypothetical protein M427DRAFT_131132 [Gonapodya prolifera JEL478]|uniref:Uncharacterized protein n=1 Tax=Gonapodya prolifera (strain JEL478) TaxID=1344416 RepID=A0A139AW41_GONPJ|nr:hypothetical protein M427DRAFT_131132 [Gonapodya prolifera JEL478]|eukprot:KXS20961.1 hypothetical protein M427DRAFT_131132 [Gonapodya prolifera JEL478]